MIKSKVLTKAGIVEKELTPMKAIRLKCLECSNWSPYEVKKCNITDCALHGYRSGHTERKSMP